jgi:pilus assembly protein CpaB
VVFFILAGIAAIMASMIVYSTLKKKDEEVRKALAGTTPIVVASKDIPLGTKISAGAIKMARWPRDSLPPGAITDSGAVLGSVARSEFVENEPIVASRLVPGDKTSGILPLMLPDDMRAMSVAVDEVSDLSGFVLPLTRVDVLLSLTGGGNEAGRSKIILENIPVLAVGQTVARKDSPESVRVVTLQVSPEQAEALAVASTQGKLHLALRSYGDNDVVATSGSNVKKVMSAYSTEVAAPPMQQQAPSRVKVRVRRVFRPRPLQHVVVLRNGTSRETVTIGRDGRATPGSGSGAAAPPPNNGSGAQAASLGDDDAGSGGYGSDSLGSDGGMGAGGVGVGLGDDR